MARRPDRDPLAPVELALTFVLSCVGASLLLVAALAVLHVGEWSWSGQSDAVCVRVDNGSLFGTEETFTPATSPLAAGVEVRAPVTAACTQQPTSTERLLSVLGSAPEQAYGAGVVVFLWWVVRRARRNGIFSVVTATALTRLGWYVVVGSLLTQVVGYVADLRLFGLLVPGAGVPSSGFPVSVSALVTGLGLVSLGRVMRHGALLQDEVDATV